MNQTTLFSFFFIIIIIIFFLITSSSSLNPKFQACNPTSCGNIPNITYPFYINGRQEPYCGYPGFSLSCPNNSSLILNLFGINHTIHEISYSNNSIRVSDTSLFSSSKVGSCVTIPRTHNLTLYGNRFHVAPNQKDVFLVYECKLGSSSEYEIGCSPAANGTEYSVLGMREEREDLWEKFCDGGFVKTKVEDYGDDGGKIDLGILKRGFLLNWTASDCSVCARTGGKCGYDDQIHSFRCYCPDRDHSRQCHSADGKSRALKLGLGLGLGLVIVVLVILVIGCFTRRHYKRKYFTSDDQYETRDTYSDDPENGSIYYGVPLFTYKELQEATNNFDHTKALGDGGFGIVYYGKLRDGREVAVKRLYEHNFRRVEQFRNEVTILANLRHKNLVSLYGCCSTSRHHTNNHNHLLLVYEYIPNGTLASHLDHPDPPLTWHTRLRIAVETASALAYLHASGIIHRDVKTANILLDGNLAVKVADFGLSRPVPGDVSHVSTAPQGTPGYVDPEYYQCYKLTSKSDVYSFGVVLMELVSSKPAVDMSRSDKEEVNLSSLAAKKMAEGEFWEVVDPLLGIEKDEEVKRMVVAVGELAVRCLNKDKEMRPTMEEVLEELKRIQNGGGDRAAASPVTAELEEKVVVVVPPGSPNTVTDKWKSESTTPNVSG